MAQWCESCGQEVPDDAATTDAVWLTTPDGTHQHQFTRPGGDKKVGAEKKLIGALAAALLAWGAFVGLGRIVTPDSAIDDEVAADIEQARVDREIRRALDEAEAERQAAVEEAVARAIEDAEDAQDVDRPAVADVAGDYGAADAAPGFPVTQVVQVVAPGETLILNTPSTTSVQAERLQRQLTRRGTNAYVAYESAIGVVLIDMITSQAWILETSSELAPTEPGAPLLRTGASSYSFDRETGQMQRVGSESSLVISDALDGATYFVDAKTLSGQASIVEVVNDREYSFHRMPAGGFQLQAVDGLGLLAVPKGPTGETLIAGVDSFTQLSENRVITGTSQALLEQVCENEATCSLVISDIATGERNVVPSNFVRFGDQYSLAPNGRTLLRYSPEGFAEVFVVGTDSIAWVIGAGMRAPVWGPNSDFIAWIDRIGVPKLKVMFPDERDWLTIDLSQYGVPDPLSSDLVVFSPSTGDGEPRDEG